MLMSCDVFVMIHKFWGSNTISVVCAQHAFGVHAWWYCFLSSVVGVILYGKKRGAYCYIIINFVLASETILQCLVKILTSFVLLHLLLFAYEKMAHFAPKPTHKSFYCRSHRTCTSYTLCLTMPLSHVTLQST